jgi:hypothetical protein
MIERHQVFLQHVQQLNGECNAIVLQREVKYETTLFCLFD